MVVVRLCTSKDDIVTYWDQVEKDLEMELDIIDDFFGEGEGVMGCNSWVNYGMPLHRLREFGGTFLIIFVAPCFCLFTLFKLIVLLALFELIVLLETFI